MDKPAGFIQTFSRPHLVRENEQAHQTIAQIQQVVQGAQQQTVNLQRQLSDMRCDGKSDLDAQSEVIRRIGRNNGSVDDMGRQIGTLQDLIQFNLRCIEYIDWLHGESHGARS